MIHLFSIAKSLLNSNLDGNTSIEEVKNSGNFGLYTLNGLDGEGILLDGVPYVANGDSIIKIAPQNSKAPFAMTTNFLCKKTIEIKTPQSYNELKTQIDNTVPTPNIFYAIKIDGTFKNIRFRSIHKIEKPYPSMKEIAKLDSKFELSNVQGTLVGFRSPSFVNEISVSGFHFHFIDDDKKRGGHVLDFEIESGKIEIDHKHNFNVKLDNSKDFYDTDLSKSTDQLMKKIEQG